MRNIYSHIPVISGKTSPLVLATVVYTSGSAPQKAGSSAIFGKKGLLSGTVGGGILEARVQELAKKILKSGKSGIYSFELNNDIEQKNEAICGGHVSVLIEAAVERYNQQFIDAEKCLLQKKPCVIVTIVNTIKDGKCGIRRMILKGNEAPGQVTGLPAEVMDKVKVLLGNPDPDNFICLGKCDKETVEEELILLDPLFPLPRLIIAGAGHIGKALSSLGKLLEFNVTVIDNRSEFANSDNLPDADRIITEEIGSAVSGIEPGPDTYIVIVTRGHSDDATALKACIRSSARYIGMIGSRTKVEKMHRNFIENGWTSEDEWKMIHAPVGLGINSKTVEEIAVSIAAELVKVRNS
jgi:xanthine dehydrogenase accessory factor